MLYSLKGYLMHTITLKDGQPPFKLAVWSLFGKNLSWKEAKEQRKKSGFKGLQIVPQQAFIPDPEPEEVADAENKDS